MTMRERLTAEWPRAMAAASEDGEAVLEATCEQGDFSALLRSCESLACAFDLLTFRTRGDLDVLAASQQLQEKISYLLEPIRLLEVDSEEPAAQLRSNPPERRDDHIAYYELLVLPRMVRLRRYEKRPDGRRQATPGLVTREVLLRLADDMASVVPAAAVG